MNLIHWNLLRLICWSLLGIILTGCISNSPTPIQTTVRAEQIHIRNFDRWQQSSGSPSGTVWLSPEIPSSLSWNELVVSWNAEAGVTLLVEARARDATGWSRFYRLGRWTLTNGVSGGSSFKNEKDERGEVDTDILKLRSPAQAVQVRLTCTTGGRPPRLLTLSLVDSRLPMIDRGPSAAASQVRGVPELSQLDYPNGRAWCSPTSIAMILQYWGSQLKLPALNLDVPEVARAVHDPAWGGTGNWPFNTALPGTFTELESFTARLNGFDELENLIRKGIPVPISVSSDILHRRPRDRDSGHLIVCLGFTSTGDVIVNDPGISRSKGQSVRNVYARADVFEAWKNSQLTAYVIQPATRRAF